MTKLLHLLRDEEAATAIEYGLILALICIAALAAIGNVGEVVDQMWNYISATVTAAMSNP